MSQRARTARRAGRVVLQVYREQEPAVAAGLERFPTTCRDGCSHCCKLPASASTAEMIPVAESLISSPTWKERKPGLVREVNRMIQEMAACDLHDEEKRAAFFKRQMRCLFLKADRCTIYALRPAVCRYYFAVSPPENCALGAADTLVGRIDLSKLEARVTAAGAIELGELSGGPIPVALVLAMRYLGEPFPVDETALKRAQWRLT